MRKTIGAMAIMIATIGIARGMWIGFEWAMHKQDIVDCIRLKDQSDTQPRWDERRQVGFYITAAEKQMCDDAKIAIDAYVI